MPSCLEVTVTLSPARSKSGTALALVIFMVDKSFIPNNKAPMW
jgi:hypothetical protein